MTDKDDKKKKKVKSNQAECTILVCSCDAYSDLWEPFFKLFSIFWPDCPYRIILNTESKTFSYDGVKIDCLKLYKPGENIPYGRRILDHLNHIDTPFVLIMMDDFFLLDKVDNEMLSRVISYLKSNKNIAGFKLSPNKDPYNISDSRYPEFEKRPKYGDYRHSMQIAVWRKSILKKTWHNNESPWDWEIWGSYRSVRDKWDYYCLKDGVKAPIEYGYDFDKGGSTNVTKGKWNHGKYEAVFEKYGIKVDFEKRGWGTLDEAPKQKDNFWKREKCRFISSGVVMWFVITLWRIRKNILKKLGFPVYKTYMAYKRQDISQMI